MPDPIYLVYLDPYHLDDLLFLPGLARMMRRQRRPPCLFVHGSGERAERLLEAEGLFPERRDGLVQIRTAAEAALVERAARQVNRQIVGGLTEEGVPAVGVQGIDRGLLHKNDDGQVAPGRIDWLKALAEKQALPVVSALAQEAGSGRVCEIHLREAARALAEALQADGVVVAFFTRNNQPGILDGETPAPERSLDALTEAILPEPEAARAIVLAGFSVILTSPAGLFGGDGVRGTQIIRVKSAK